ncbi:MAG: ribosome biogenesis GTP-binding protein YihA/YsxC [Nevskiales bacterium]
MENKQIDFSRCQFLKSAQTPADFPPEAGPEIAFSGRSNAGKSSALNLLTGHAKLARVSKTPGRTQLINFFDLDGGARLVDLPGYGYAKVPKDMRQHWRELIETYIEERATLRGVVVLMDSRHPLADTDCQLLTWLQALERPAHVLLTKADKLSRSAGEKVLNSVRRELKNLHLDASVQLFSVAPSAGLPELDGKLKAWITKIEG